MSKKQEIVNRLIGLGLVLFAVVSLFGSEQ